MLLRRICNFGKARSKVKELHTRGDHRITEDIRNLASGPAEFVKKYKGFIINGFRFHTKDFEENRKTQNSGVMLEAMTNSFSSARDNKPIMGDVTYYGVLNDIIELEYAVDKKVVLFHCDWISNVGSRKKQDENGFTLLNFEGLKPHNEPFILACQAHQVFYGADRVDKGWKVVIKITPRDSYDMNELACFDDVETHLQSDTSIGPQQNEIINIELVRRGNGTVVDKNTLVFYGDEDLFEADS